MAPAADTASLQRALPRNFRPTEWAPNDDFREDALDYLGSIIENNGVSYHPSVRRMQFHRIMWIHEWLKVLHERDELSESDTVLDLPD